MDQQQNVQKRGIPAIVCALLLFIFSSLSAFFLAEGYSFVHFFDLLSFDMRSVAPTLILGSFLIFGVLQVLSATLLCEMIVQGKGKIAAFLSGALSFGLGFYFLYVFCEGVQFGPAFLSLSFLSGGRQMAVSYMQKEQKSTTILKASFGSALLLLPAVLLSAATFAGGFGSFFGGLVERVQHSLELMSADAMENMIFLAGGKEPLAELLASATVEKLQEQGVTVAAFLENYKETLFLSLSSLLLLLPSLLFSVYTILYYFGYGVLRLFRILSGDREKRPLTISLVPAIAFFVSVIIYTVWSMLLGGGGVFVLLVINLLVMLTPGLAVLGVKYLKNMFLQLFAKSRLMAIVCLAIVLFNPLMVLALSGCYAVFGEYLTKYLEKRAKEDR